MDIDSVKEVIKQNWKDLLEPARKSGYVCPVCGNGTGSDGTGIKDTPDKPGLLHCFKCDTGGDILSFWMKAYNLSFEEAVRDCSEKLKIQIDDTKNDQKSPVKRFTQMNVASKNSENEGNNKESCVKEYLVWQEELLSPDNEGAAYLKKRGISLDTAKKLNICFAPNWRSPAALKKKSDIPSTPRLIFPTSDYSYTARDIRENIPEEDKKFIKQKQGKAGLFNIQAIQTDSNDPIFIVEGEIDAASFTEIGYDAVAIGGTSGVDKFFEYIKKNPTNRLIILALDNDNAGRSASEKFIKKTEELDNPIDCYEADETIYCGKKDANDALISGKNQFKDAVKSAAESAVKAIETEKEKKREEYKAQSASNKIDELTERIRQKKDCSPTGFEKLDNLLDGGLYPGLYILGAVSALGKTTLCLQIADQIAASGRDVLYFALEMSEDELMAKSISRNTYLLDMEETGSKANAKTTRGILAGQFYAGYSKQELEVIEKAKTKYASYADHIYIFEGVGDIGAEQVRTETEKYMQIMERRPIVFIDYLQLLAPHEERATDKQNTDRAVLTLKRMARDLDIPVVAISSFNRESYTAPVSLSSFKESGMIEFGSDALIGLQYKGMDYKPGQTDKGRSDALHEMRETNKRLAKEGRPIDVQVKLLKNRNGITGDFVLGFIPAFNIFLNDYTDQWVDEDAVFSEPY